MSPLHALPHVSLCFIHRRAWLFLCLLEGYQDNVRLRGRKKSRESERGRGDSISAFGSRYRFPIYHLRISRRCRPLYYQGSSRRLFLYGHLPQVQSEPILCLARDCCGTTNTNNDDVGKLTTPCSRSSPIFDRATYHMYTSSDFAASTTMDHNQILPYHLNMHHTSYTSILCFATKPTSETFQKSRKDVPSSFDFLTRPRVDSIRTILQGGIIP